VGAVAKTFPASPLVLKKSIFVTPGGYTGAAELLIFREQLLQWE